ncbi:hypothetical protein QBC47DRAFT_199999 [Echria macrotheca]|uniref:Uncharacterized protein n=1 Tax=Echria macrotheca TaxID=438768 RepID=A0AAJ0FC87_9PEZI|nr:hypothetical protein QBC47DRAFT_199999 [Echria macrotheca]
MVGRRRALLAAAVLGLDAVLGGPILARDVSADVVLTTVSLPKKPPVIPPLIKPTTTSTSTSTESTSSSVALGQATQQSDTTVSVVTTPNKPNGGPQQIPTAKPAITVVESLNLGSSGAANTDIAGGVQLDAVSSTPTLPTRPQGGPGQIPTAKPAVTVVESLNLGGTIPANTLVNVDVGAASPTSSLDDYPYPGLFGAGGPVVTDPNAPTRSVEPSMGSVAPTSSIKTPPPFEITGPGRLDPIVPAPSGDGSDAYAPDDGALGSSVAASSTSSAAPAVVTAPRGPPPKLPPLTAARTTVSDSIDLGIPPLATPVNPESYAPSFSVPPNASYVATGPVVTGVTLPPTVTGSVSICQPSDLSKAATSYSIIHTSTITWVGDPADYTPEFPPLELPPATPTCLTVPTPARLTISTIAYCSSTGTGTKFVTCVTTTTTYDYGFQTTATVPMMAPAGTIIIITTDKNPAVVYSTPKPPNYGVTTDPKTRDNHNPATDPGNQITTPIYDAQPTTSPMRQPPTTDPVTVAVKPTAVVINDNTIVDDPSGKTQTVIVSGVTFAIGPTEVIGGGATIDRNSVTGGVFLPTPTTTQLNGLNVVVSSHIAVVGGSAFTLGPTPQTAVVSGQTVVISPTAVAVGSQTLNLPTRPAPTEEVVAGGDLITAIGQSVVVIKSTTITYGPSSSTTVIDNDTITFGAGGITAHGTTLGGSSAKPGQTDFAVVGGATITKVGASVVVINSVTYTVGPGTGTTTTVVGGQTVTIGPDGVKVSTLSLAWPFGPTTVITPGATAGEPTSTSTAAAQKDAAGRVRVDKAVGLWLGVCLVVGAVVVGV